MTPFFVLENFLEYLRVEKRFSAHTILAYENDLKQFLEFTNINTLDEFKELNHQIIRYWIVNLVDQDFVSKSINRKLSSLRSFVKWSINNGYLDQNPTKKIVAPKIAKRLPEFVKENDISSDNISQYFQEDFTGVRNRLIIEMLYQTGVRLSELINLKLSNISNDTIKVLGKRNKERIIPISEIFYRQIQNYILHRNAVNTDVDTLFILDNGKKIYEKLVYRVINTYLSSETNLEKRSPHVLRHTFATHMMNNGAGLEVLKDLLGHANLSATQVYTHNSFSQLNNIYSQAHPRGQKK
jgi:integrase/recombinase XerC